MRLQFNAIAQSDLGLVRDGNEDSALISNNLIAVADGMGGHAGGEVASAIAINTLQQLLPVINDPAIDLDSRADLFLNISYEIDAEILRVSKEKPELSGMGTTLTALSISGNQVDLLHIGDSRCYRWRDNKLEKLSYDHTVMQELLDQGRLTPEEVFDHPQRSLLTQALMGDSGIDPVLMSYEVKVGDKFLLCSDGLTNVLSELEIAKIIKSTDADELLEQLIEETKAKGAPDNITIIWAQITESDSQLSVSKFGAAK
ncbi:MAG: protein phosphatase 2C domain-containing protein [Actinomycetes bacterium]